jgi:16S rRNA (adenine1518-N6/adenine1519-N6)-dimethyltransferase
VNLTSPTQVKGWCIERGFHPNRTLGQNFLIDRNALEAILDAADLRPGQRVLEAGPGLGVLTEALLDRDIRVTAVEKDHRLCAWLRESLGDRPGLTLIESDMLETDLGALLRGGCDAFVSNLPYSVGTRILLDVAMHPDAPPLLTILVQTEVAERFSAPPRGELRGLSGVWLQRLYDVALVRGVKPTCFWPKPEVGSTVVRLTRHDRYPLAAAAEKRFVSLTKLAFMHRRKQLASVLRHACAEPAEAAAAVTACFDACGIPTTARAEELTLAQWCALAERNLDVGLDPTKG